MAKTQLRDINAFVGIPSIKNDQPDIETKRGVGRPRRWDRDKKMLARFDAATMARIEQSLKDGESKVAFINEAALVLLAQREKWN
jgi:hypothetical protein